jgi:tetratricopeptide (TPR) repeat protein
MAEAYTLKAQACWENYFNKNAHQGKDTSFAESLIDTVAAWCRRALSIDKYSADANTLLGLYCFNTEKADSAIVYLQRALTTNPNHSEAYRNAGNILNRKGEYLKAYTYLQKAVKLDPFSLWAPFAYNSLGFIYITVGDFRKAEALLNKSIQMEKGSLAAVEALRHLTHANIVEGNGAKVLETAQKWLQLDSLALRSIAEAYSIFYKDYPKSNAYFQALFKAMPEVTHSKHRWGLCFGNGGNTTPLPFCSMNRYRNGGNSPG